MIQIGFSRPNSAIGRLIAQHDQPGHFCHAYLIFDGEMRCEAHADFGVRFHPYKDEGDEVMVLAAGLSWERERQVRRFCEIEAGCGYDFSGIAALAGVPLCRPDPERWFCSELVVAALQNVGAMPGLVSYQTTPNGLYLAMGGAV